MEALIDFLVNNYLWFLVMTIILIFALIGYIVEDHELKKLQKYGGVSKDIEQNFEKLAMAAQNKMLGDAVAKTNMANPTMNSSNMMFQGNYNSMGNPGMMNSGQNQMNSVMNSSLQNNSVNFPQGNSQQN